MYMCSEKLVSFYILFMRTVVVWYIIYFTTQKSLIDTPNILVKILKMLFGHWFDIFLKKTLLFKKFFLFNFVSSYEFFTCICFKQLTLSNCFRELSGFFNGVLLVLVQNQSLLSEKFWCYVYEYFLIISKSLST